MTAVRRGLLISLLCLVALATGSARADSPTARRRARRDRRRPLAEAARDDPLGRRAAAAVSHDDLLANRPRAPDREHDPAGADPLALPARGERHGCGRAALTARPAHLAPGRRQGLSERPLPHPARPQPAADRRSCALGPGPDERRPGNEDRDHRRGDRPDASVLLARRIHHAARLPEGPGRVHDGEGDRRTRVPTRPPDLEARRQAVRSRVLLARHARRRDRGRQREHARRGHADLRCRTPRLPGELQGPDDPDRCRRGSGRQLARARRRDRSRGRGRDGRDQHVARRARDRALARHRRAGARRGRPRRRRLGRLCRQRLRRLRPRLGQLARICRRTRSRSER